MVLLYAFALQVQIRAWQPDFSIVRDVTFYEHGKPQADKYEIVLTHRQGLKDGVDEYTQTYTSASIKESFETYAYRLEDSAGWVEREGTTEKAKGTGKAAYEEKVSSLLATSSGKNA